MSIDDNEAIRLQWHNSIPTYRTWLQALPEAIYSDLPNGKRRLQKRLDLIRHYRLVDPSTTEEQKSALPGMEGQIQAMIENIEIKRAACRARWTFRLALVAVVASVVAAVFAVVAVVSRKGG